MTNIDGNTVEMTCDEWSVACNECKGQRGIDSKGKLYRIAFIDAPDPWDSRWKKVLLRKGK